MRRSLSLAVAAAVLGLAAAMAGCTFQTSEDPVYYNPHAQHLVGGASSGTPSTDQPGGVVNSVAGDPSAQPPVQAGVTPTICAHPNGGSGGCDPEPSPWNGGGAGDPGGTTPGGVSNIRIP